MSTEPPPQHAANHKIISPARTLVAVAILVALVALGLKVLAGHHDDGSSPLAPTSSSAVPTAPADAPREGMYVQSTIEADGSVRVQQWIRSTHTIVSLRLAALGPDGKPTGARADNVVVATQTGTVLARPGTVDGERQRVSLGRGSPALYLSYTINGATSTASSTVADRMLANVVSLDVDWSGVVGAVVRMIQGPGSILDVACVRRSASTLQPPRPCGSPVAGGGWRVDLHAIDRTDRLIVSLALS